ncbi:NDP-sugar pyrophosphorylase family protein [Dysgonomonadaceae bacterium PH5-43]|nr:NDP-sugar pyrophosphorylase family protein [Dysgonomonadaceae bacterium PH5-43]
MKAMIFAAGLGSRLKPITDSMPKALVRVHNKPLLQIVIENLKAAGFNEIVVNVHHFSEQIIDFLNNNNNFDIKIGISDESDKLLDTGGGIKKASHFFNDNTPFLVHNVDILSNINLNSFYNHAKESNASACLLVSERITNRYLLFNDNDNLVGWINEATGEIKSPYKSFDPTLYKKYAFGGLHIIHPSIFGLMNEMEDDCFSIIDFYLSVCDKVPIKAYTQPDLNIVDIGKTEVLMRVNSH